jgi:hypothetical protein
MTSASRPDKTTALLWLAAGKTNRVAAEAAGASPSTVSEWRKNPAFAEELAALTELYGRKPLDGTALLARLEEARDRLAPPASTGGVRKVRVRVPAGTSQAEVRRRVARAAVRSLAREVPALKKAVVSDER